MWDRVAKRFLYRASSAVRAETGQALVETALVIPILLLLAFGVVAVGRVVEGQMAVSGVAREAARAAALANNPQQASANGLARGQEVAAGYSLSNGSLQLTVDPGSFARGGVVRASARYTVTLGDLPLLNWGRITVGSTHLERIDLYRSHWPTGGGP